MQRHLDHGRQGSLAPSRSLPVFFGLAFAITWAFWGLAILAGDTLLGAISFYGCGFGSLHAALTTIRLIGGGNEEPGWRGFALPELQQTLPPFVATLGLGVLWALWHIPLIGVNGGGFGAFLLSGPEWIVIGLTLISITTHAFWYAWLYNRTGSVLLCVILHGSYNAANRQFVLVPEASLQGGDETRLLAVMTGLLVASVIGLQFATGGRLGKAEAS
jgi:membrane protease YdiL (CAAX protease family)